MSHHDESLIDKVKNALGMGDEHEEREGRTDERADGWAGVPQALHEDPSSTTGHADAPDRESGLGRNPGPVGSAAYEGGATPDDFQPGEADREEAAASQHGGAYGADDTPMPTSAAWDRGEAPPEGSELDEFEDRRERGI